MHLDFFTYNKPGVENLPCAYWVFSISCTTALMLFRETYLFFFFPVYLLLHWSKAGRKHMKISMEQPVNNHHGRQRELHTN